MRLQLATSEKVPMTFSLLRTSRNNRSMTFVVRMILRCSTWQRRKGNRLSMSFARHLTAPGTFSPQVLSHSLKTLKAILTVGDR